MRLAQTLGKTSAIVMGVLAGYIGAYWFARKSEIGSEFFSSGGSPWQGAPVWMQRAEVKFFNPGAKAEKWLGKYRQKRKLVGEWVAKEGKERLTIDENMTVTLWGFTDMGFPDGSTDETTWGYWGTADAYLVVFKKDNKHSMQVFTIPGRSRDELFINRYGPKVHGALTLIRKQARTP